jgi:predicted nucleic acid-binding protein
LCADRRKRGRPVDARDTMIAGIVLASHAKLATRNVKHFEEIAPSLVNPWQA